MASRKCCCVVVCGEGTVAVTLSSIDFNKCGGCIAPLPSTTPPGFQSGYQINSLSVDGTYSGIPITSGVVVDHPVSAPGAATVDEYLEVGGVCVGGVIAAHTCNQILFTVNLDCGDLDLDGNPRVFSVIVDILDTATNYRATVFSYNALFDGGSHYANDSIPNVNGATLDCTPASPIYVTSGGSAVVQ